VRLLFFAALLGLPAAIQAQVPWLVSVDLDSPNRDHGLKQVLLDHPLGWSKVVTLGGETARALATENPSGRRVEGLYFDIEESFAAACEGKTFWVLLETYSPQPEEIEVHFPRLGADRRDLAVEAAKSASSLPRQMRAERNQWGFLLFRCENASPVNGLEGEADFRVLLPDNQSLVNRVMVTRVGPEFDLPDTGGLAVSFYPQNYGRILGPTFSPLPTPGKTVKANGEVRDSEGISEVGGALVRLVAAGTDRPLYETYTDPEGAYEFSMVEPGQYELQVSSGPSAGEPLRQAVKVGSQENADFGTVRYSIFGHPFLTRYRSKLDRTEQIGALYLPRDYQENSTKNFPLIVALHEIGQGPLQCLQSLAVLPNLPAILVAPGGRGDSNYEGIGEADVLETIDLIAKNYRVDPDRIHLTGVGMGGTGSLKIAARYPDRFSSISAVAAFTDLLALHEERYVPAFQARNLRIRSPRFQIPNLRGLSVRLYQPAEDALLLEQGRNFREEMSRGGQTLLLREVRAEGGNLLREVYGSRDFFEMVLREERNPKPSEVIYQTDGLTPGGAYWAWISEVERGERTARIHAKVVDPQTIWLESANVAKVRVSAEHPSLAKGKEIKVWWNGKLEWTGIPQSSEKITLTARKPSSRFQKTPYQSGSASEVFLEPYLYVMGDKLRFTEEERAYREWIDSQEWTGKEASLVGAQELSPRDLRENNLILFGLPEENSLVVTLMEDLPLRVEGRKIQLGDRVYEGRDLGFATVFPNPLAENRLILWVAGFSAEGIRNLARTGFRWPDYLIVDNGTAQTGEAKDVVAAGFYDQWWRYDESQIHSEKDLTAPDVGKASR
jgi:pimeloyl-ACP methyl ester carboxylesterase